MKRTTLFTTGSALLAGLLFSLPATAIQDFSEDAAPPSGGFVGLGVRSGPDYEGGDDYKATVVPFGYYRWGTGRNVSLAGTSGTEKAGRLKANVLSAEQGDGWELGPLLQYRKKRDDVENKKVDRLKEVDAAIEAGAFVGYTTGKLSMDVSYATDVSSEHDGYLWYLNGRYKIPVNDKFSVTVGAHLTWADDDFMKTYFGVSGGESVKSGLPKYSASSGFKDAGLGLTGVYKFNKTWGMAANVGYTRMLNDAEDSPLVSKVGDENQYEAVVAVMYSF